MTAISEIKFEDRKLALQQKGKEGTGILSFVTQDRPKGAYNLKLILVQKRHLNPTTTATLRNI